MALFTGYVATSFGVGTPFTVSTLLAVDEYTDCASEGARNPVLAAARREKPRGSW